MGICPIYRSSVELFLPHRGMAFICFEADALAKWTKRTGKSHLINFTVTVSRQSFTDISKFTTGRNLSHSLYYFISVIYLY